MGVVMPYIKNRERDYLEPHIEKLVNSIVIDELQSAPGIEGTLNFAITSILLRTYQKLHGDPRYKHINGIVGILECAKQEMYRRVAGPYEDVASIKNGDLPEFEEWGD